MKNFFRTIGAFLGLGVASGNFSGEIIPKNPLPKRFKSERLPESILKEKRAERQEQIERSMQLRMKRYGLKRFTDGTNTVFARDEKNGMRKLRNLQTT